MFNLITKDELKQTAKGEFDDSFDYLLDSVIIPAVSRMFAHYCGRPDFDKSARTEYLSPEPGAKFLFLKSPPVAAAQVGPPAIEALRLYQDTATPRAYGTDTELTSGEDFFVHETEGMIEHAAKFAGGPKTVKVTYTGGYLKAAAIDCPEDLRFAAITQSKILFDRREEYGITGRSLEGGSITLLNTLTLPRQVTMMLDPYRIMRV